MESHHHDKNWSGLGPEFELDKNIIEYLEIDKMFLDAESSKIDPDIDLSLSLTKIWPNISGDGGTSRSQLGQATVSVS